MNEQKMHGETLFSSQIAKIRRRLVIRAFHGLLLNATLVFLFFSILLYVIQLAGITDHTTDGGWQFICVGLSLLVGLIIGLSAKPNLKNSLIEIDRRLAFRDRLSTAYEYFRFHPDNEYTGLLIQDAAAKLRPFKMQHIMPIRLSRLHLVTAVLLLIYIFLYLGGLNIIGNRLNYRGIEKIENAAKLLKNYSVHQIDNKKVKHPKIRSSYAKKIEEFSRSLDDNTKSFKQHLQAVHQFREEVQGERARLTDELASKLGSAGIRTVPIQKFSTSSNLSADQLAKLKGFLNKTLKTPIPGSIDRNIEMLQELDSIEKLVSRIIKNLEDNRSMTENSDEAAGIARQVSPPADSNETRPDGAKENYPDQQLSDPGRTAISPDKSPDSHKSRSGEDSPGQEMGRSDAFSAKAGRATSDAEKKSSDELQNSEGVLTHEKIGPSPAKNYLIQIRALTEIGEAHQSPEEIFRSYRKEVESILQKEDIPPNYREYIKNYFLSIGIQMEENAHEN